MDTCPSGHEILKKSISNAASSFRYITMIERIFPGIVIMSSLFTLPQDGVTGAQLGLLLPFALLISFVYMLTCIATRNVKAPMVGHRSVLEPAWLVGYRFTTQGRSMLRQGYHNVRPFSPGRSILTHIN